MSEISIVAHIDLKPGRRAALMPVLAALVEGSRAEAGNISYELTARLDNENALTVLERWASRQAIDQHGQSPHFQAFVKAIEGQADRLEIIELGKIM